MFCAKCGTQQPDDSKFCVKCGTGMATGVSPGSPVSTTPVANSTAGMIVGWILVAVAVVLPFTVSAAITPSFPLLWIGFGLVFAGKSIIIRAGKGFVGMLIVMVAIIVIRDNLPTGANSVAMVPPAQEVPLSNLLGAYASGGNEIAADQKYKGQVIKTNGILKEVKKDIADHPYVIVGMEMGLNIPDLQCSLAKSAVDEAVSLKAGQPIVVQGEIRGLMLNVQADECVFVKPASATRGATVAQEPVRRAPPVGNAEETMRTPDATPTPAVKDATDGTALDDKEPTLQQIYDAAKAGNLPQAQEMIEKVLRDHPQSGKAHYVAAKLYALQGNAISGREELRKAEEIDPGLTFANLDAVQKLKVDLGISDPQSVNPDVKRSESSASTLSATHPENIVNAGPSFDCGKAASNVEKLICETPRLAADDSEMASFYKKNLAASGANATTIRQGQREFIAKRNQCATVECITEAYRSRHEELAQLGYVRE